MLEPYIRSYYQRVLVDPVARALLCGPTTVTAFACFVGVLVPFAIVWGQPWWACGLLFFSGFLDTLDGTLARLCGQSSASGAVFDIISDRVVETAVVLGLFAVDPMQRGWFALGMLASILICVTSFLVVGIFTENDSTKGFHYSAGIMERPEAFVFFAAMILLPHFFVLLSSVFIGLVLLTTVIRVWQFTSIHENDCLDRP